MKIVIQLHGVPNLYDLLLPSEGHNNILTFFFFLKNFGVQTTL